MNAKNYLYGLHAIQTLLEKNPSKILQLFVQKDRLDQKAQKLLSLAEQNNIRIKKSSRPELDNLTDQAVHQGFVAEVIPTRAYSENDLPALLTSTSEKPFLLLLDGIQDPHNLGACLRSADAAGVHAVIAPKDKSVGITPTVSKVASGAAESVPFIQVTNLARTMEYLKDQNIWLYGATGDAPQTIYETDFTGGCAIVLGAEGDGLRRLTKEQCDILVSIPMVGSVESLNVSVATGICLFEVVRQRGR